MPATNRRDLLKLTNALLLSGTGAAILAGAGSMIGSDPYHDKQTEFDLGPAENFPLGSKTVILEGKALLTHAEEGFNALSLICTHLGCVVEQNEDRYTCPCHGSEFDDHGNPIHKPATNPLRKLAVTMNAEGRLILFTG